MIEEDKGDTSSAYSGAPYSNQDDNYSKKLDSSNSISNDHIRPPSIEIV